LSAAIASALGIVQLAPAAASRGAVSGQPRWVVNARLDATQQTRIGGSRHIETI